MTAPTTQGSAPVPFDVRHGLIARGATATAVVVCLSAAPALAQVTHLTVNKCLAGKIKGVGKSVSARTGCFSKEAGSGVDDPACHEKASDKFTGGSDPARGVFGKLEGKYPSGSATPCLTFNDQQTLEIAIAESAANIPAATGSGAGPCDAAKIKCIGKYVAAVAKCASKAASKTGTVDASCTGKASAKLANGATGCLDNAALQSACTHSGSQAAALQAVADQLIRNALCVLDRGQVVCESASSAVGSGGSVTTDAEGDSATVLDPLETTVTAPNAGEITIDEVVATGTPPSGFQLLGQQANITAPSGTALNPLHLRFVIDASEIPAPPQGASSIQVFKDGALVLGCSGSTPGAADPDPCEVARELLGDGDLAIGILTSTASVWSVASRLRYLDNGDGTVTDTHTGLQWEQKTNTAGLNSVDNRYNWAGCCNGKCSTPADSCQPNAAAAATCVAQASGGTEGCATCTAGTCNVDPYDFGVVTTVWDWVTQLNAANFAGHTDWRLPAESACNSCYSGSGGYSCASCSTHELETILLAPWGFCGTFPCIDPIFGPTAASGYWSATTYATDPQLAWSVYFFNGYVDRYGKGSSYYVRAVRGGS